MTRCDKIRPLLHCVADGEAAPREALAVARHISDCTACRIRLARERRLAEVLDEGLADLPVDERFVDAVMARLPREPRPVRSRRRRRRGLRLAGLFGLIALPALALGRLLAMAGPGAVEPRIPVLGPETAEGVLGRLTGLVQVLALALDTVSAHLPRLLGTPPGPHELIAAVAVVVVVSLAAGSALLALAARSLLRP